MLFRIQKTSAITVKMNEAVTVTSGAAVKMPDGITDYGTIALDPNDKTNKTIIITPIGSNERQNIGAHLILPWPRFGERYFSKW